MGTSLQRPLAHDSSSLPLTCRPFLSLLGAMMPLEEELFASPHLGKPGLSTPRSLHGQACTCHGAPSAEPTGSTRLGRATQPSSPAPAPPPPTQWRGGHLATRWLPKPWDPASLGPPPPLGPHLLRPFSSAESMGGHQAIQLTASVPSALNRQVLRPGLKTFSNLGCCWHRWGRGATPEARTLQPRTPSLGREAHR